MYQMSPDTPRQMYADLLESVEQERLARVARKSPKHTARPTAWLAFINRVQRARWLTASGKA